MKPHVLAAVVLLSPLATAAQSPAPVPVAVIVKTAQFEDQAQKDRLDSADYMRRVLRNKKQTVVVVEDAAKAVVVVEVLSRASVNPGTKYTLAGREYADEDKVVKVKLSVGEYSTEIEGRSEGRQTMTGASWNGAATLAAVEVEKWIKNNRGKLPK